MQSSKRRKISPSTEVKVNFSDDKCWDDRNLERNNNDCAGKTIENSCYFPSTFSIINQTRSIDDIFYGIRLH